MILDKEPLPDDPTPSDAPPSYDTIASSPGASGSRSFDPISKTPSSATSPGPTSPALLLKSPSSASSSKPKTPWFRFLTSRTAKDVRLTVLGLVRDLVQEHDPNSPAAIGILQSCAEVSSTHGVSLSAVLQEKSIEEHTPLYRAIVKRPPDASGGIPDLLSSLLLFSTPLKPSTISDIRLACLVTSDQPLFHRLRQLREFNAVSPADEMLLGREPGEEVTFAVRLGIGRFQKRMMVARKIEIEFISRGRMWKLEFFIAPPPSNSTQPKAGSWCVALSLSENSPPAWIDSRLLVPEPPSPPSSPSSPSSNGKKKQKQKL
ncbi:hypothetical protein BDQ17DRAFT_1436471 [Cyathus striatus]|nr:hypothetical protein BDQ17DRAFT_1436471 [Cyathus striatus]